MEYMERILFFGRFDIQSYTFATVWTYYRARIALGRSYFFSGWDWLIGDDTMDGFEGLLRRRIGLYEVVIRAE